MENEHCEEYLSDINNVNQLKTFLEKAQHVSHQNLQRLITENSLGQEPELEL